MGDDDIVVTAVASRELAADALWSACKVGRDGWAAINEQTRRLPEQVAEVAGEALAAANETSGVSGAVLGSIYGTGHVAETIRARLDANARLSLDPTSFLYFNAHGVTANLCMRQGLRGPCITLLGHAAGLQAFAAALRRLRIEPDVPILCGEYELISPAAAMALEYPGPIATASFLLIETAHRARERSAPVLGTVLAVETQPDTEPADGLRVDFPLRELTAEILRADPDERVTVTSPAACHVYRATLQRGSP
jgi:hypothetical protein